MEQLCLPEPDVQLRVARREAQGVARREPRGATLATILAVLRQNATIDRWLTLEEFISKVERAHPGPSFHCLATNLSARFRELRRQYGFDIRCRRRRPYRAYEYRLFEDRVA